MGVERTLISDGVGIVEEDHFGFGRNGEVLESLSAEAGAADAEHKDRAGVLFERLCDLLGGFDVILALDIGEELEGGASLDQIGKDALRGLQRGGKRRRSGAVRSALREIK